MEKPKFRIYWTDNGQPQSAMFHPLNKTADGFFIGCLCWNDNDKVTKEPIKLLPHLTK